MTEDLNAEPTTTPDKIEKPGNPEKSHKLMRAFFKNSIKDIEDEAYHDGYNSAKQELDHNSNETKALELQYFTKKPIICISGEWRNPIIGVGLDVLTIEETNNIPTLLVYDYLTNTEVMISPKAIILPFTSQRFHAIMKLNPSEMFSLLFNQEDYSIFQQPQISRYEDKETILQKLARNRFFQDFQNLI